MLEVGGVKWKRRGGTKEKILGLWFDGRMGLKRFSRKGKGDDKGGRKEEEERSGVKKLRRE